MVIFVAGPLSATETESETTHVKRAMAAGLDLMKRGHQPVVPHLSVYMDQFGRNLSVLFPYERWLELSLALVERCDALLYLAPSPGADRERARAEALRMPIYRSLEEVPDL